MAISAESWRFFDPSLGIPDPTSPPTETTALYQLSREVNSGREEFRLLAPFGYLDRTSGRAIIAPNDLPIGMELAEFTEDEIEQPPPSSFTSDFTSVPDLLTWLVPKTGSHLPAALTHDSMIGSPQYAVLDASADTSADGFRAAEVAWRPGGADAAPFTAVDADRIFRDAMADSGTGVVRRWLIWAAVTIRTMVFMDGTSTNRWQRWYYAFIALATIATIAWLGYQATAQLFDRSGRWPCSYELPWITNELPGGLDDLRWIGTGFGARLVSGGFFALLLPIPVGVVLWGRFRWAGVIAGMALAFLIHITIAVLLLSAAYLVLEAVVTERSVGVRRLAGRVAAQWRVILVAAVFVGLLAAIC